MKHLLFSIRETPRPTILARRPNKPLGDGTDTVSQGLSQQESTPRYNGTGASGEFPPAAWLAPSCSHQDQMRFYHANPLLPKLTLRLLQSGKALNLHIRTNRHSPKTWNRQSYVPASGGGGGGTFLKPQPLPIKYGPALASVSIPWTTGTRRRGAQARARTHTPPNLENLSQGASGGVASRV